MFQRERIHISGKKYDLEKENRAFRRKALVILPGFLITIASALLSQIAEYKLDFYSTVIFNTVAPLFFAHILVFGVRTLRPLSIKAIIGFTFVFLMYSLLSIFFVIDAINIYKDVPCVISSRYLVADGYANKVDIDSRKGHKSMRFEIKGIRFYTDNFNNMSLISEGVKCRIEYLPNSRYIVNIVVK